VLPFLPDQASVPQLREVEGERAVGDAESLGDCARGHAFVARLHEEAEEGEAMLLCKRAKRFDSCLRFHGRLFISKLIEMSDLQWLVNYVSRILEMSI
jgi:hypothetical protein